MIIVIIIIILVVLRIPTCDCSISYLKEVLPSVLMRVYIFLVLLHSQILTIWVKSGVHHSW